MKVLFPSFPWILLQARGTCTLPYLHGGDARLNAAVL